jgi:hypothetical protein
LGGEAGSPSDDLSEGLWFRWLTAAG